MAWGSPLVTRRRIQPDQTLNYSSGTVTQSLQHVGMLKGITFGYNATYVYTKGTGGSTQDQQGPFNAVGNFNLKVNGIGTFLDSSAWNLYLYDLVHFARTNNGFDPSSTENANILQSSTATSVFSFPAVPGASGNITILWQLRFPFTVEIANVKEVGLFVLQNDEINLAVTPSFNATAGGATKLAQPYITAGGDTFALGTPTLNLTREFYGVPGNKSDYPVVGWFHQVTTTRFAMTTNQTDCPINKGGVILRVIYQCIDGSTPSLMSNANISRLQWLYGSNDTPYDESITDVLYRQRMDYGHDLPQGAMVHDFWGHGGLTMRDTFDTQRFQNLRGRIQTPTTPNAGSYVDVTVERLIPIGNTAEALY